MIWAATGIVKHVPIVLATTTTVSWVATCCFKPQPVKHGHLSFPYLCLASIILDMKAWHSLKVYSSKTVSNWLMHVSICQLLISVVLLIDLNLSVRNCLSALIMIWKLLHVLKVFLSLTWTGAMPAKQHLNENLLWLPKSTIWTICSYCHSTTTLSFLNFLWICRWRFLIWFKSIYKKKIFLQGSDKQKNLEAQTSFHRGKQHGFFRSVRNVTPTTINTYHG